MEKPSFSAAITKSHNGLCSKFEIRETAYDLRDSENKLNFPLPRTNYYENNFSYSGATLWNRPPRDLRQVESLGLFKRLIKEVRSGTAFVESSFTWVCALSIVFIVSYLFNACLYI